MMRPRKAIGATRMRCALPEPSLMHRVLRYAGAVLRRLFLVALMVPVSSCAYISRGSAPPSTAEASSVPSGSSTGGSPSTTPTWNHPAEGLAIVRFPDSNSPVSHVFVVDSEGALQQVTGVSRDSAGADYPDWSPDHRRLVVGPPKIGGGSAYDVAVVRADGSDEHVVAEGLKGWWSPDGARLLVEGWDYVRDLPVPLQVVQVARSTARDLVEGFNGQWLADDRIGFQQGTSVMVTTISGEARTLPLPEGTEPRWSPDGSSMLFLQDGAIFLADGDGTGARRLVEGFAPVWSPDGTRFAFAPGLDPEAVPQVAVADLNGTVAWSGVSGTDVTWSPDGTRLAAGVPIPDATVRVLDAASGEVLWEEAGMHPAWN